jgi:polygalacturonase
VGSEAASAAPESAPYDVRSFGASGDGSTLATAGLQAAIDRCHAAGGGTVLVPAGRYLTGTLYLRTWVRRCGLTPVFILLSSTVIACYPTRDY